MIPAYYRKCPPLTLSEWNEVIEALRHPGNFSAGEAYAARQFAADKLCKPSLPQPDISTGHIDQRPTN